MKTITKRFIAIGIGSVAVAVILINQLPPPSLRTQYILYVDLAALICIICSTAYFAAASKHLRWQDFVAAAGIASVVMLAVFMILNLAGMI